MDVNGFIKIGRDVNQYDFSCQSHALIVRKKKLYTDW